MEEQRTPRSRGWGGGPPWWRHGPLGRTGPQGWTGGDPGDSEGRAGRLPWRSTLLLTVLVLVGSQFAAHAQVGDRAALDPFARALLLVGCGLLLWRQRRPVLVAFGTAAVTLVYLAAGYPYGPVFVTAAVGCFGAVVAGHRRAAWAAIGMLWLGHLLMAHWLYHSAAAAWGTGRSPGPGDRRRHLGRGDRGRLGAGARPP